MGILTFAAPVSGLRGKVGGNIFSANKSGPYLKAWGKGSNPRSLIQTNHRGVLIKFSQAWSALSTAEKDGWDTYGAAAAQEKTNSLGEGYFASGFSWFVAININRTKVGDAQLDTAPVGTPLGAPTLTSSTFYSTDSSLNSRIRLTAGDPGIAGNFAVHCQMVNSVGRLAQAQVRLLMDTKVVSGALRWDFETFLEERFGTIQVDQKAFWKIAPQDAEGRIGSSLSGSNEVIFIA